MPPLFENSGTFFNAIFFNKLHIFHRALFKIDSQNSILSQHSFYYSNRVLFPLTGQNSMNASDSDVTFVERFGNFHISSSSSTWNLEPNQKRRRGITAISTNRSPPRSRTRSRDFEWASCFVPFVDLVRRRFDVKLDDETANFGRLKKSKFFVCNFILFILFFSNFL